jgi:hypothetical protein
MTGPAPWPADRTLSAAFVETLLTNPRYAAKLAEAVTLSGARVGQQVAIADATLTSKITLDRSRFDGGLEFDDTDSQKGLIFTDDGFGGPLNIRRSAFNQFWFDTSSAPELGLSNCAFNDLDIVSARIPGALSITATKIGDGGFAMRAMNGVDNQFGPVTIDTASIGGTTGITDSHFAGKFEFNLSTSGSEFFVGHSQFAAAAAFSVSDFDKMAAITHTDFDGGVSFIGSKFEAKLVLDSDTICLRTPTCELSFGAATLDGAVAISNTLVNGDLNADVVTAASSVYLSKDGNAQHPLFVSAKFASFARDVGIDATTLGELDLGNTIIAGGLLFSNQPPDGLWTKNGGLDLENADIGVLYNSDWAWPGQLDLDGVRFGWMGVDAPAKLDHGCIEGGWSRWLRNIAYSPQPYDELAQYLRQSGKAHAADCVLETSETRAISQMAPLRRVIYWTYGEVAGFGFAPELAFKYVVLFVLIGIAVLKATGQGVKNGMPIGMFYSFSQLIPLVSLDRRFEEIELTGFARWYFYLHKIAGYVIAIFITAALSSLSGKG